MIHWVKLRERWGGRCSDEARTDSRLEFVVVRRREDIERMNNDVAKYTIYAATRSRRNAEKVLHNGQLRRARQHETVSVRGTRFNVAVRHVELRRPRRGKHRTTRHAL